MTGILRTMMAAAGAVDDTEVAEAIDFDGTNDYLRRTSDFTGNSNSKTFTFSAWFYYDPSATTQYMYNNGMTVNISSNMFHLNAIGTDTSWPPAVYMNLGSALSNITPWTFFNVLVSVDVASTSTRKVYINDVDVSSAADWYDGDGWYRDVTIDFTVSAHSVAANGAGSTPWKGRLSDVYLDYTYRDLDTESERRKFITADLKPVPEADLAALSPILYVPMTDPDSPETNAGTGGDLTLYGTIARSGRGPNQDNCVASLLDGSADYLHSNSVTGLADSKVFTFSLVFQMVTANNDRFISSGASGSSERFFIRLDGTGTITLNIGGEDTAGAQNLSASYTVLPGVTLGSTHSLQVSIDLADTANRVVMLDGVDITAGMTWTVYVDSVIDLLMASPITAIGRGTASGYVEGDMGEVYFDTVYTDLATDNPFWDSDLGKPVSVRQVIDDTGVTPLMALPMRANDAGNNLGSGGDFTVNSGPYTGARGASEFWARSVNFVKTESDKLTRASALTGAVDGKTFTFVMAFNRVSASVSDLPFSIDTSYVELSTTGNLLVVMRATGGGNGLYFAGTTTHSADTWNIILVSVDMSDTGKRHVYMNGATVAGSYTYYVDTALEFSDSPLAIADEGGNYYNGQLGFIYFSTDYIDFSDEANRLLFVDAFGYPTDLSAAIDAGDVASPLIYMKFDDTSDLGVNSGTGGDYTESGTPTVGADVTP